MATQPLPNQRNGYDCSIVVVGVNGATLAQLRAKSGAIACCGTALTSGVRF